MGRKVLKLASETLDTELTCPFFISSDVSTLQNDSAYDSNDPDAESPSAAGSPSRLAPMPAGTLAAAEPGGPRAWASRREPMVGPAAGRKSSLGDADRRYSEPSMASSQECPESGKTNPKLTRSEDDFTRAQPGSRLGSEDAEDPFHEEVFPAAEGQTRRPSDLKVKPWAPGMVSPWGLVSKACSSGSLDASDDGSPVASPSSPKRNFFARHRSFTKMDKSKPGREIKKHSMSFSFASHKKVLSKTPSLVSVRARGLGQDPARRGPRKESQLAGRVVQEHLPEAQSRPAPDAGARACAPSAEDVFCLVDQRSPGSPPSYREAIRCQALDLGACGSQTVGSMRARMLSLDAGPPPPLLPFPHGGDSRNTCRPETPDRHRLSPRTEGWKQSGTGWASVGTTGRGTVIARPELRRPRTVSESRQTEKWDGLVRRCSPPVFEADQLQYAKESYV